MPDASNDTPIDTHTRAHWLVPLALIGGAYGYVTGGQVVSTDDAYVNAETVGISTDVSGIVQQIDVADNQI